MSIGYASSDIFGIASIGNIQWWTLPGWIIHSLQLNSTCMFLINNIIPTLCVMCKILHSAITWSQQMRFITDDIGFLLAFLQGFVCMVNNVCVPISQQQKWMWSAGFVFTVCLCIIFPLHHIVTCGISTLFVIDEMFVIIEFLIKPSCWLRYMLVIRISQGYVLCIQTLPVWHGGWSDI